MTEFGDMKWPRVSLTADQNFEDCARAVFGAGGGCDKTVFESGCSSVVIKKRVTKCPHGVAPSVGWTTLGK